MLRAIPPLHVTLLLVFALDTSWQIGNTRIPPLGKFLDPVNGFWQNAETEDHKAPEELALSGLQGVVDVVYDSLLIPHIFASSEEDIYLAQGYVTAAHRLWQMEFQTHASAGRLSSILGVGPDSAILNYDRRQRRFGMTYAANHALQSMKLDEQSNRMIERYTEGINQYIRSLSYRNLPLEYKLMDYYPEDWTPLKCALLLKSMCQTLNMGDKDIQMTNALQLYGLDVVELLYPDREPNADPIVDNPGGWAFDPVTLDTLPPALPKEAIHITGLTTPDPAIGSNNWAVSGSKTESGAPILCNDPHLNTTLPSIWYAAQLQAPGLNVMGVSLPGAPGIIIGFNDSIAWGVTNAQRDLIDWYRITYKDTSRTQYKLDNEWKEVTRVVEEIHVRGKGTFYDTVRYTVWGPVPYDRSFHGEEELSDYAFRWTSHDPSNELLTFAGLNRAKNHTDFMNALDHFKAPAQNFVFASVSGDIAIRIQGKYPVRRALEGKFVLDGSESTNGWQAFIPDRQNVMMKNPARGFVSSANQHPVDSTYPYYVTATSFEAYRNRRINQVLRETSLITIDDMKRLQNDNFNLKAAEALPVFLTLLDSASLKGDEKTAYELLRAWDLNNTIESEAASYFEAWWNMIMYNTWDEMRTSSLSLERPTAYNTIKLIKESPDLSFFDIQETTTKETATEVVRLAFSDGVKLITDWKSRNQSSTVAWGDYKDTFVGHLARLEPFGMHVQHGGNNVCVNASTRTHGPSWRMIVSLDKTGIQAYATYPGGQSGNPGSIHYTDLLDSWSKGEYHELLFLQQREEATGKARYSTKLVPKER